MEATSLNNAVEAMLAPEPTEENQSEAVEAAETPTQDVESEAVEDVAEGIEGDAERIDLPRGELLEARTIGAKTDSVP